jgi:hypothetical protein
MKDAFCFSTVRVGISQSWSRGSLQLRLVVRERVLPPAGDF